MTTSAPLQARLLGRPAVFHDDRWLSLPHGKSSALLYYLAYQDGWVDREDLVYLFWPDTDEHRARGNLRPLLTRLRRLAYTDDLEVEPTRLRWDVHTDVRGFREALRDADPARAVQLRQGDLLEGIHLPAAPEFESWLELERAELQRVWRKAALELSATFEAEARHAQAAELLERLVQTDPLDEEAFRRLLVALARAGRASEVPGVFATFCATLEREVGGEPETATHHLVEQVRSGSGLAELDATAPAASDPPAVRPHRTLPALATHFVGREAEIAQLLGKLRDPACRLVAIVAPGGMGKTRLAIEMAERLAAEYHDGVCFVPFDAVDSPDAMVSALADALTFTSFGKQELKDQLLDYLEAKDMLLVLDNLEHLLDGVGLVAELLEKGPGLTVLATSRERLGLHAEWVYDLAGMGLPEDGEDGESGEALEQVDAVRLFVQSATRSRADFSLDGVEEVVARVCRAVGGMPLAIELAASWLRVLGPDEIAAELEGGLDLLETSLRDLPARHHDIRTVFETSWRRLSPAEQAALRALAVFHGGFTREAAREVAGVGVPLLLALANKSFVRREPSGRFSQHPLMWQVLREQASADADAFRHRQAEHAAYFAAFVEQRAALLQGLEADPAREAMQLEFANVRAAWLWAAEQGREDLLEQAGEGLTAFLANAGRFQEGEALFADAAARLQSASLTHGRLLLSLGVFLSWRTRHQAGAEVLERSIAIFQAHGAVRDEALALEQLKQCYVYTLQDRDELLDLARRCAVLFHQLGETGREARALMDFGFYTHDPAAREEQFRESVRLLRGTDDTFNLTLALTNLAVCLAETHGRYQEAYDHLGDAVATERAGGMAFRLAWWLNWQGRVLRYQGRYDEARERHREARAIGEGLEPGFGVWELDHALFGLGRLALAHGELGEAAGLLGEALEHNRLHPDPFSLTSEILDALAGVALEEGRLDDAAELCRDALRHLAAQTSGKVMYESVWIEVLCRHRLGEVHLAGGDPDGASEQFARALDLARDWHLLPATLHLVVGFADLALRRGDVARAARLLAVVADHPAATFETRAAARSRLGALPGDVTAGLERGRTARLEEVVEVLLMPRS